MARKGFTLRQIVEKLRPDRSSLGAGQERHAGLRDAEILEECYNRWRKDYGGLQVEPAKRPKELKRENNCLRRLVVDRAFKSRF